MAALREAALAARDTRIDTLRLIIFGQSSELALQTEQLERALDEFEGGADAADSCTADRVSAE